MNYRDRTGNEINNDTSQDRLLQLLYGNVAGRAVLKLLTRPGLSELVGKLLNTRASSLLIDSFIKKNKINMREYIPCKYNSYNEFFIRKIRSGKRPVCEDEKVLISPSDGKVSVYPITADSVIKIKNSYYTVASLLRDDNLAACFNGGYCMVIRLTVDNYHRYSYAATGRKGKNIFIQGRLHTVNPAALEHVKIYSENSREYTVIDTVNFGKMVQMEVGALIVGRIKNHHESSDVIRGQEKGYFEFGGSSIVLLLQREHAAVDDDLIKNTDDGCETLVKLGEQIGKSV